MLSFGGRWKIIAYFSESFVLEVLEFIFYCENIDYNI